MTRKFDWYRIRTYSLIALFLVAFWGCLAWGIYSATT